MKRRRGDPREALRERGGRASDPLEGLRIELKLYTTGATPLSSRAIVNIRRLCDAYLEGRYALEIVDVVQHPEVLKEDQIVAAPTLIKRHPLPTRRFIGDMSATETILRGLDVAPHDPDSGTDA